MDGSSFLCEIHTGPASGLIYPVTLPVDKAIWAGTYEAVLADSIARSISSHSICCDIGGFRGYFSGLMAARGAQAVHVFEPFPDNCEQITRMMAHNPGFPITLHRFALGHSNGEFAFSVHDDASMGKLEGSTFKPMDASVAKQVVQVRTLDSCLEGGLLRNVSLIKMDVEGAEADVIRGGGKLLNECHPTLFIEAHSRELCRECTDYLTGYGYKVRSLETGNPPDGRTEPEVCHLVAMVD